MLCDDDARKAASLAVLVGTDISQVPVKGFQAAIRQIQQTGRPLTADIAERLFDSLGGPEGLADRMTQDLKAIRGEGLSEEQEPFHVTDYKTLKNLYELIVRVATCRDELVHTSGDILEGLTEQDLIVAASNASLQVLHDDPEFRAKVLGEILKVDPNSVIDAAMQAIDQLESASV